MQTPSSRDLPVTSSNSWRGKTQTQCLQPSSVPGFSAPTCRSWRPFQQCVQFPIVCPATTSISEFSSPPGLKAPPLFYHLSVQETWTAQLLQTFWGVLVLCASMDTLVFKHGVHYRQTVTRIDAQQENTGRVHILRIMTFQLIAVIALVGVEVYQQNNGVPNWSFLWPVLETPRRLGTLWPKPP